MFKALKDQPTCQEIKKKNVWITRHNWEENTTETSDNSHWSQSYVFMFILTFFHESQAPMNQCTLQFPCQHTCNLSSSSLKLRLFFQNCQIHQNIWRRHIGGCYRDLSAGENEHYLVCWAGFYRRETGLAVWQAALIHREIVVFTLQFVCTGPVW